MDVKKIIGVTAVLALAGGAIYMLTKKKGSGATSGSILPKKAKWETALTYMSKRDGQSIPLHLKDRPAKGTIVVGDTLEVSGGTPVDGNYTVEKVWIDGRGNVGAVYVTTSYTPTGANDRTYENKAILKFS